MISSTSAAKSGSSTGVSPVSSSCSFASAMHSEMDKRGGSAARRTAAGCASLSITISAPARTRASRPGRSRAAPASELCRRHSPAVKKRILSIVRNQEDTEDALQDTLLFVPYREERPSIRPGRSVGPKPPLLTMSESTHVGIPAEKQKAQSLSSRSAPACRLDRALSSRNWPLAPTESWGNSRQN